LLGPDGVGKADAAEILIRDRIFAYGGVGAWRVGTGRDRVILFARIDEVKARQVTIEAVDDFLVTTQFKVNAPTTVAGLDRHIHLPNFRSGAFVKCIGHLFVSGGRFDADAEGNVAVFRPGGVQQPRIPHQPQVAQRASIRRGRGHFHHTQYHIACAYALLNKNDLAIEWLGKSIVGGFSCYPLFECDANLANLKTDPRFLDLLAAEKKRYESFQIKYGAQTLAPTPGQ
jgi:hypothetical protein